jgi:hypothetical protein
MLISQALFGIDCSPGAHANFFIFLEKKSNKNSLKKEINLGIFFFTKPDRIAKTKTVFWEKIRSQMDVYYQKDKTSFFFNLKTDRSYGKAFLGEILIEQGWNMIIHHKPKGGRLLTIYYLR